MHSRLQLVFWNIDMFVMLLRLCHKDVDSIVKLAPKLMATATLLTG